LGLTFTVKFPVAYKNRRKNQLNVKLSLLVATESPASIKVKTADKLMLRAILEI